MPSRITVVATLALIASVFGFGPIFLGNAWLTTPLLLVVVIVGVGIATRFLDLPIGWTVLLQVVATVLALTTIYVPDSAWGGFIPTPESSGALIELLRSGLLEAQAKSIPIIDTPATVLLLTLVVAPAAVLTDNLAATDRPVLAGLPLFVLYSALTTILKTPLPLINYVVPVAGFLALLWVDESTRKGRWGRSANDARGFGDGFGVLLAAGAIILGLLVPALIPTPNGGIFQLSTGGGGGTRAPGVTASQLTDLGGQLNLDQQLDLFTVRTSQEKPQYLRTTVLEKWDGNGWSADRPQPGFPVDDLPQDPQSVPTVQVGATVTVEAYDDRFVPVYYRPRTVTVGSAFYYDAEKGVVFSPSSRIKGRTYRLSADVPTPNATRLSNAVADPTPSQQTLQQPPDVSPQVQQIVDQLIAGKTTPYDKTLAVNDYFTDPANDWVYSLTVPEGDSGDPLLDFLTNRTGFCEQYASSMASLLRLAGVPSRVVIGYTAGTKQTDGSWKITTSDAHAWVEAQIGDAGWVTFDPTPIGTRANPLPYAPRVDAPDTSAGASASAASASAQSQAPQAPQLAEDVGVDGATGADSGWSLRTWLIIGVSVLVVALLLASPYVVRTRRRRRRLRVAAGDGPDAAHSAWAELIDTATDHHRPVDRAVTPRKVVSGWGRDLRFTDAELAAAMRVMVAEEEARYAPTYVGGESLAGQVRTVRAAIERRTEGRARTLARLFPATWRGDRPRRDDEER